MNWGELLKNRLLWGSVFLGALGVAARYGRNAPAVTRKFEAADDTLLLWLHNSYPDLDVWAYQNTGYQWEYSHWELYMVIGEHLETGDLEIKELEHNLSTGLGTTRDPSGARGTWSVIKDQKLPADKRAAKKMVHEFLKSSSHWKFHGGIYGPSAGWRLNKWYHVPTSTEKVSLENALTGPAVEPDEFHEHDDAVGTSNLTLHAPEIVTDDVGKGMALGVFVAIGGFAIYKFVEIKRYAQWKAEYEATGKIPSFTPH